MNEKYIRRIFTLIDIGVGVDPCYESMYNYLCKNLKNIKFGRNHKLYKSDILVRNNSDRIAIYDPTEDIMYGINNVDITILASKFNLQTTFSEYILIEFIKHKLNL